MTDYALKDIYLLFNNNYPDFDLSKPDAIYLCALFADLAYRHVPEFEIDAKKRAKIIPSNAYQRIVKRGIETDISSIIGNSDFDSTFLLIDRGVIVVGVRIQQLLFVAVRGTQFLFDWKINLKSSMVELPRNYLAQSNDRDHPDSGGRHRGFLEESVRISASILSEIVKISPSNQPTIKKIIFTGHSLGGAVAALVEPRFRKYETDLVVFGCPRFTDIIGYETTYQGMYTHVRRANDMVPTVPPRIFGYADHPNEVDTDCNKMIYSPDNDTIIKKSKDWFRFMLNSFEGHNMENYRREIGSNTTAKYYKAKELCEYRLLIKSDIA